MTAVSYTHLLADGVPFRLGTVFQKFGAPFVFIVGLQILAQGNS